MFLLALLHSDGEILVGLPCFPPMLDALRGLGARTVTVSTRFEDGYRVDLDAFRDSLSARTRLVMFASPQNPSGVSVTHGEIDEMLAARLLARADELLSSRGAQMARARDAVESWIGEQDGRLQWRP